MFVADTTAATGACKLPLSGGPLSVANTPRCKAAGPAAGHRESHAAYLCLLLVLVTEHSQVLHQLQALHVPAVHKALLCCLKVKLLQGMLRQQSPEARVCVVCNERASFRILPSSQ
jgi:hypothetical protein